MAKDQTFNITADGNEGGLYWQEGFMGSHDNPYKTANTFLWVGHLCSSGDYPLNIVAEIFLRFTNITIPRGATITNAKITLTTIDSAASTGTPNLDIQACDEDNSAEMTGTEVQDGTMTADIMSRVRTTANVNWSQSFSNDTVYETPDIKTVVQEVIDRAGWASGNAMQFIISDHTYKYRTYPTSEVSNEVQFDADSVTNISINIDYTYYDSGLRIYKGGVKKIGCYSSTSGRTSKLRTYKGGVKHIAFDSNLDSGLRVYDGSQAQVIATAD